MRPAVARAGALSGRARAARGGAGPLARRAARRRAARAAALPEDDPRAILRVSKGTDFQGLLAARREAVSAAGEDEAAVARAEGAFRRLVSAAEERFKEEAQKEGSDAEAHFQYGNFLQTTELFAEAEEEYIKALEKDQAHVDAMNNLATLRLEVDDDAQGAQFLWRQALDNAPEDIDVMFNLARAARALGEEAEVDARVDEILKLRPEMTDNDVLTAFRETA